MVAAQRSRTAASYMNKKAEAQIENQRTQIQQFMKKLNPNVEVPQPKQLEIKKYAINLPEYDELRKFGNIAPDLSQPADAL